MHSRAWAWDTGDVRPQYRQTAGSFESWDCLTMSSMMF